LYNTSRTQKMAARAPRRALQLKTFKYTSIVKQNSQLQASRLNTHCTFAREAHLAARGPNGHVKRGWRRRRWCGIGARTRTTGHAGRCNQIWGKLRRSRCFAAILNAQTRHTRRTSTKVTLSHTQARTHMHITSHATPMRNTKEEQVHCKSQKTPGAQRHVTERCGRNLFTYGPR
jgi:hypothetical protein